jgi:quercetin dioxygenase-like cupin family protein
MIHFPDFMKNPKNKVDPSQQNTDDVEGFYCEGKDKLQIAFWECHSDRKSKKHKHNFDEYMVLVSGEYIAYLNNKKIVLKPGDELYIPRGTEQWGECKAGTRSIHAFGGKRVKNT